MMSNPWLWVVALLYVQFGVVLGTWAHGAKIGRRRVTLQIINPPCSFIRDMADLLRMVAWNAVLWPVSVALAFCLLTGVWTRRKP